MKFNYWQILSSLYSEKLLVRMASLCLELPIKPLCEGGILLFDVLFMLQSQLDLYLQRHLRGYLDCRRQTKQHPNPHSPMLTKKINNLAEHPTKQLFFETQNSRTQYFCLFCCNLLVSYFEHNSIVYAKWFPLLRRSTRIKDFLAS